MNKGIIAAAFVLGAVLLAGCVTPAGGCGDRTCTGGENCATCSLDCGDCPFTSYCGDGTCDSDEDCATCSNDCGACPTSGRDQLIALVQDVHDRTLYSGDSESEGRTITFTVDDAVTSAEVARAVGMPASNVGFWCSYNRPDLAPPASLGCVFNSAKITPTETTASYVYVNCAGQSIVCSVDFQMA